MQTGVVSRYARVSGQINQDQVAKTSQGINMYASSAPPTHPGAPDPAASAAQATPATPGTAVDTTRTADDTHTSQAWMYRSEAFAEDLEGRSSRFASLNIPPAKKRLPMVWVVSVSTLLVCLGFAAVMRWA